MIIQSLLGIGASIVGSKMLSKFSDQRINIVHAIPGRIRLNCAEWKNENTATSLEAILSEHSLVKMTKASPLTGSLLIEFTQASLTMKELDEILLHAVNVTTQCYSQQETKGMQILKRTFIQVDETIRRKTKGFLDTHSLVICLLVGKGIHSINKNKHVATSLFFGAYTLFVNQKDKPL